MRERFGQKCIPWVPETALHGHRLMKDSRLWVRLYETLAERESVRTWHHHVGDEQLDRYGTTQDSARQNR